MELNKVLERLQSTIDKLKNLDESQFEFTAFVTDWRLHSDITKHHVTGYGVVCDTVGWYPRWYPESGFTYKLCTYNVNLFYEEDFHPKSIIKGLMKHHGISQTLVGVLFFGECFIKNSNQQDEVWFKSANFFTLDKSIERFEMMHTGIEMGLINPNWESNLGS